MKKKLLLTSVTLLSAVLGCNTVTAESKDNSYYETYEGTAVTTESTSTNISSNETSNDTTTSELSSSSEKEMSDKPTTDSINTGSSSSDDSSLEKKDSSSDNNSQKLEENKDENNDIPEKDLPSETNHKKGQYAFKPIGSRVKRAIAPDNVYANDVNLPGKDFIDVASWNGNISISEYKLIKSYGVSGVAVKLTEGTYYINPYAESQIANAKAAGLKVMAYHFSMYTNQQEARDEANYFARAANQFGLAKDTVMVNDAEHPSLINNAQQNSLTFNTQLKANGFFNDALYVGRYWIDSGYIDTAAFNKNRVWVAQYPYTPTVGMMWNNDHGAWQWSSQMFFPGLTNYQNRAFDMSAAYNSFYGSSNTVDLSKYFTTNPKKVILRASDKVYSDTDFKNPVGTVAGNELLTVDDIEYSSNGVPRLKISSGFVTANKAYAVQVTSNIEDYFVSNPGKVILLGTDSYYNDYDFTTKIGTQFPNEIISVSAIEYSNSGVPRLKTPKGYLTANKKYVRKVADNIDDYYTQIPKNVVLKGNDIYYADVDFTVKNSVALKDEVIQVTGLGYSSTGVPRFKTDKGYITANKRYVLPLVDNISDYFTENPSNVILRGTDSEYAEPDFKTKVGTIRSNSFINIVGIKFSSTGVPRLETSKGTYITANRKYVVKVTTNIANYFTENPKRIILRGADYYYDDYNFSNRIERVSANTLIDIMSIEYGEDGIPRLRTAKGYITANKKYTVAVPDSVVNYYTESPKLVVLKNQGNYYSDRDMTIKSGTAYKNQLNPVLGIEYRSSGLPVLKTSRGYISAKKTDLIKVVDNVIDYFTENPEKVVLKGSDYYYKDADFTQKVDSAKAQTINDVIGIEFSSQGYPRIKTKKGYITANKKYVIAVTKNISDYYSAPVKSIKLTGNDYYYSNPNFTKRIGSIPGNTEIKITGIAFSDNGVPRFKAEKGYLTANKKYVKVVRQ